MDRSKPRRDLAAVGARGQFESGGLSLAVDYTSGSGQDEHGNLLSFSSHAYVLRHGKLTKVGTTDVFFRVAP